MNLQAEKSTAGDTENYIRKILNGEIAACETAVKKALRLFVSSTFTDTKPERNYLMREIYPHIRAYCEQRGIRFRSVLRFWKVLPLLCANIDQKYF